MRRVLYAKAVYGTEEIEAVADVLANSPTALMTGFRVEELERSIAKLSGSEHGLMVNSGSSANLLALAALDLEAGSEVITPALTFSTTVAPIVQLGLIPAFVDVEPRTFNADAEQIREAIGPNTAAIMIPNLIGNLPDWQAIRDIADAAGVPVIEDSADTLGATYRGRPTGHFADVSTTSLYASHVVTGAGFGGMLTSDSDGLIRRARLLRGWGRESSIRNESEAIEDRFGVVVDGVPYDAKFVFSGLGYNFLPSEISAAFALVQLERLEQNLEARKKNFAAMLGIFARWPELFELPLAREGANTGWLAFPLVVRASAPFSRTEFQVALEKSGIQTRVVFTGNILRQPAMKGVAHSARVGGYPVADSVMEGGVLLGCHHGLDEADLEYVEAVVSRVVSNR